MNRCRTLVYGLGLLFFGALNAVRGAPEAPPPVPGSILRVLAPAGHFPDWLQQNLGQKLQTKIEVTVYAHPDEARTLLAAAGSHFDLALIPDRIVPALIAANSLRPLPAAQGVRPDHLYLGHYFDRDNKFVLPYAWGLLEIAYDSDKLKDPPHDWIDLSAPAVAKRTFFADPAMIQALDQKGIHWASSQHRTVSDDALQKETQNPVTETEATVRVDTYGALKQALAGQAAWKFILPPEGSIIVLDHLALPAGGTNPRVADNAVALFMDPANTSRLAAEIGAAVTQKEALPLVAPEQAKDPLLYPPMSVLNRCSFAKP